MSAIVRSITDLRPESLQIPALEKMNAEQLLDFLKGIKDPDFHKERHRLEETAEAILRRKQHDQGRTDFKESHWWARWEVWLAAIGIIVAVLLSLR